MNSELSVVPFEYSYFNFCTSNVTVNNESIQNSFDSGGLRSAPFMIVFGKDVECSTICTKKYIGGSHTDQQHLEKLKKGFRLKYQHHWFVGNHSVLWCYEYAMGKEYCVNGFPMGCLSDGRVSLLRE